MVVNNTIQNNTALEGGGIRWCYFLGVLPPPIIMGNVVDGNSAATGGGMSVYNADPVLYNTTIDGNTASGTGGGCWAYGNGNLTLNNSIVSSNSGGGLVAEPTGSIVTSYNDVWNNIGGDYINCVPAPTDLNCDPEYCDMMDYDYRLYQTSCCNGSGLGGADIGALGVGCFTIPGVLFYDNFSDQNDDGWVVQTSGDASLTVQSGTYLARANSSGGSARGLVMNPTPVFGDFQYHVKFTRDAGPVDPAAWMDVLFRYQDRDAHYVMRLNGLDGNLWKFLGGTASLLTSFPCQLPFGQWREIVLVATGCYLQGFLSSPDGTSAQLFSYDDVDHPILMGTIGVGLESIVGPRAVRFDNILVARPDPSAVPGAPRMNPKGLALVATPNPSVPPVMLSLIQPRSGPAVLDLYNVLGAHVRRLLEAEMPGGLHRICWDGRDAQGHEVPAGIYLGRLEVGGDRTSARVLVLR